MSTIAQFLRRSGQQRCFLLEVDYLLDGQVHTLRRSTHPFHTRAGDTPAWTPYRDTITDMGEFDRAATEAFYGQSVSHKGDVEMFLDDEMVNLVKNASFSGLPVTIKLGAPDWAFNQFIPIITGAIGDKLSAGDNTVSLSFKDRADVFAVPVQASLIETGPNAGKPKPISLGQCFNVSPVLIDEATNTWMVNDGPVEGYPALRENGVELDVATKLTDNLDGTFSISGATTGRITVDVLGAKVDNVWLQTADEFIGYFLDKLGLDPAFDSNVFPASTLGLYISTERQVNDVLDEIVSTFTGAWWYDRNSQLRLAMYNGVVA